MPTDAYWAVAAAIGWTFAGIFAAYAFALARQLNDARKQLSRFDHDGDGKVGGSRPKPFRWDDDNLNTWGNRLNDRLNDRLNKL